MLSIRPLLPSDEEQYTKIWHNALFEQAEFFRTALEDNPEQKIPTKFNIDSFTIGIFDNGVLKGSVSIERDTRAKFKHKALLFKMFVCSELVGKGIGRSLITQAINSAQRIDDLRQLYLTVLATNHRAIHLYSSLGFIPFAHEPEAIKINDTYVDEIQMVCFLGKWMRQPNNAVNCID